MRPSLLLLAASSVTAAILPRDAPNLPLSAFGKPMLLSYEDALAGKDLIGKNFTAPEVNESPASTLSSASAASCAANPNMRIEWNSYSTADRNAFVKAVKCLMNKPTSGRFSPATNRYEDFVRLHQIVTPNVHGNAKFLVWHRYFVWTFEQVLRAECQFTAPMPWWDETKIAGAFAKSSLFTQPYFGNLLPAQSNGQGWCINSGYFGGITLHIGPGSGNQAHCLTRAVNEELTGQCNTGYVNLCNSRGDYASMESCAEGGPHAYGHNGIGAVMSDVSASPSDPIFWMHHLFVDRNFRVWQNMGGNARVTTINGNDVNGNALTMNTMVSVMGIRPDVSIGQIMNTLGGNVISGVPFCYRYDY